MKGAGEEHRVKVYILRAGLARRLVVMVTDVGIVPFLYCLRQSLFNAIVLAIYSNILSTAEAIPSDLHQGFIFGEDVEIE